MGPRRLPKTLKEYVGTDARLQRVAELMVEENGESGSRKEWLRRVSRMLRTIDADGNVETAENLAMALLIERYAAQGKLT